MLYLFIIYFIVFLLERVAIQNIISQGSQTTAAICTAHQSKQRILARSGFFGSFDAPLDERSWINLFVKRLNIRFWI